MKTQRAFNGSAVVFLRVVHTFLVKTHVAVCHYRTHASEGTVLISNMAGASSSISSRLGTVIDSAVEMQPNVSCREPYEFIVLR